MENNSARDGKWGWLFNLLLILVLVAGIFFRFLGVNWDQSQHPHPDERFLTMVETAISPVQGCRDTNLSVLDCPLSQRIWVSPSQYFNSATSPLNPYNRGYGFYVYGTLPLFIVRYTAEIGQGLSPSFDRFAAWLNDLSAQWHLKTQLGAGIAQAALEMKDWTGYDGVNLAGRELSALADLGTIILLYFIVAKIYGRRTALLATAFSSLAVMQIQQSHFFTVDNFVNFFMFLGLYLAVEIAFGGNRDLKIESSVSDEKQDNGQVTSSETSNFSRALSRLFRDRLFWLSAAFGLALGMAVASKINAAALAIMLPAAFIARHYRVKQNHGQALQLPIGRVILFLVVGALFSLLAFRIFQPYAFAGPGFFNLKLEPGWVKGIMDQRAQASPNADLPWSLQWARRTHLFSFQNLTVWGLGLPLGILAWIGFLWMAWRMLKGEWRHHALLWGWTALYFLWQSLQFNPTMRYQLPIYPLLAMMAAWIIVWLWDQGKRVATDEQQRKVHSRFFFRFLSVLLGVVVLALTAAWAFAFTSIYTRTETRLAATEWIFQNVPGPINLSIQQADGSVYQEPLSFSSNSTIQADSPYNAIFIAHQDGVIRDIYLDHVVDTSSESATAQTLSILIALVPNPAPDQVLASASVRADFSKNQDSRGASYKLTLDRPVTVTRGQTYVLYIQTTGGTLTLTGSAVANETDFDLGLPFRTVYDGFGGIYQGLNLQVYWDDNTDKLIRYTDTLNQADYIFIPSNHQFAQIVRLPERYPLTTVYYRELLGCPPEKDIIWCYNEAEPGMFQGRLGFDLAAVFSSYPTLGVQQINDQYAEEAFTIYDHAKVFIFQKRADYDPAKVAAILGAVDLSHVIHLLPGQAASYKDLMLPTDQLAIQQVGGTWSDIFNWDALQNKYPGLGGVLWYVAIFLVGLFTYPLLRAILPGLADRGYPLARMAGLLLWAWFAWMAGSVGIPWSKGTIGAALGLVMLIGLWQVYRQRAELKSEWGSRWKYFLLIEAIFLAFFLLDLFIRLGNPDLWHPSKGGERPMDFSYFNAVLKSTTFPPYDPWFGGGYINYYYYGYVIVGTPVKLLGIVPSIAYNFILPTLFAMLAMGAFSVGWNLLDRRGVPGKGRWSSLLRQPSLVGGLSASAAMVLIGNLGIVRMFYQGFQRLAAPGGIIDKANILQRLGWAAKGFVMALGGANLPFGHGDFYWFPSRALPDASGSPITEFPLFTFLYSDLHAHMIALPLTVLVIAWALSILLAKAQWKSNVDAGISLAFGGLVIGALKPTNTWDFYTYLILGILVLIYTIWRYLDVERIPLLLPAWTKRALCALGAAVVLAGSALLFYQPFLHWFAQAYNSIEAWKGGRSDISSYLVHWGVFLFFITSWMAWETHQWMADTPVSALRKLKPYRDLILSTPLLLLLVLAVQQVWVMSSSQNVPWKGITILWLALPLAAWAGVLLLRSGLPDAKRLVLFMTGTALVLTIVVEVLVLRGDIGRMNTVFKFYLQAWILLGLSAAAAFGWLLGDIQKWLPGWRNGWQVAATLLVAGAGLFLLIGGMDKVRDRMALNAPRTLDSMAYMNYAQYADFGVTMDLSEDYRAIRWMQENVQGSPVIVEANCPEYRWCSRFTIYTGLPGVLGWNWHQRQQRALMSDWVWARVNEINAFYATTDPAAAEAFLRKYNVRYIILGQLERAEYIPATPDVASGLPKFEALNGVLWREVYRDGQTVIYQSLIGDEANP